MSHFHKSDDVLSQWLAVADRATPPARAPRGSAVIPVLRLALVAAVAIAVVAAVLAPRLITTNEPVAASPSATAPATTSSATASIEPTPTAIEPTPTASGPTPTFSGLLTTNGASGSWTGFTWGPVIHVASVDPSGGHLRLATLTGALSRTWGGGYAAVGSLGWDPCAKGDTEVWLSMDGTRWDPVMCGQSLATADGPAGFLTVQPDGAQQTIGAYLGNGAFGTCSADTLPPVVSLAGTPAGYVATTLAGDTYGVYFSADCRSWLRVSVESGIQWDGVGPLVQSDDGRFFLMGGLTPGSGLGPDGIVLASSAPTTHLWWSDDGRNWTRVAGATNGYGTQILAARDGLMLITDLRSTPGGSDLYRSVDGGKTWTEDPGFGPLGAQPCQGECNFQPNGVLGSNGAQFVAIGNDGRAWTSYDGLAWSQIDWGGPSIDGQSVIVLPHGVIVGGEYGAAR